MLSLLAIARRKPFSVTRFTAKPVASVPHFRRFFCSSSTNPTQNLAPKSPIFIVDYLISSFGFSPDKAARVSKSIAHVKSPEKPDSVRHFLEHNGFTHAQIKTIITWNPKILCSSPENTLGPNLRALRHIGLSNSALTQIIMSDPDALHIQSGAPRIKFWKDFLGASEATFVRACKINRGLASRDHAPNIHLLRSLGLSTREIQGIVLTVARFISRSPAAIQDLLKRAKELGFHPGSPMFLSGLHAISWNSREALRNKMELLKSYGWSDDDISNALRKSPNIVHLTEKNLRTKMDFLLGEARCDLSYIASNSLLLAFSLEKRLRPRQIVLHLLESKGLCSKEHDFIYSIKMTDKKFVETYIQSHKEDFSGLHEAYLAALRINTSGLAS